MSSASVVERLDAVVDDFSKRNRLMNEDMTPGRAKMFVMQHRMNSRFRNSVLKLRVATNTPHWDVKLGIIGACAQEIIADDEFGGGRPHWKILEDLGVTIGLRREDIENAEPLPTTRIAWYAWEGLMSSRHWLEGLIANTCSERTNIPGYGTGQIRERGWLPNEAERWRTLFGLSDDELEFFGIHGEADVEHSDLGWNTVAKYAQELGMEDAVVTACHENLLVWELYMDGIADAGDRLG